MKEFVVILFGGVSPEHDVSVITGLQVFEHIDKEHFTPLVIYQDKKGIFWFFPNFRNKQDFLSSKRIEVSWGKDRRGGYVRARLRKIHPTAAYLAFHGGGGEGGEVQGFLQNLDIAITSPTHESSTITMNKVLTKEVLARTSISLVPGLSFQSHVLPQDLAETANEIECHLGLPVIVKPAHLGSSIGIQIATTLVELEKALNAARHMDTEILVETFIPKFEEYNVSVFREGKHLLLSEIERPLKSKETLSFEDKYKKGGAKKTGGGMASLARELPANTSSELADKIRSQATSAYEACRCSGTVRVDFMATPDGHLYLSEINSIPGSLSYYLWEATGISFRDQITRSLREAQRTLRERQSLRLEYDSEGIIEAFLNGSKRR